MVSILEALHDPGIETGDRPSRSFSKLLRLDVPEQ